MMIKKQNYLGIVFIALCCFFMSCGAGTLGGLETKYFLLSKKKLELAMDSIFVQYPEYKIPEKWLQYDDWSKRGYDFLASRIYYFESAPEEMYYVSFVGTYTAAADTYMAAIAVRAVFSSSGKWLLEDDMDSDEEHRIEHRFNQEIISKLEMYTGTKAKTKE